MNELKRALTDAERALYLAEWTRVRGQYGPDEAVEGRAAATEAAEAKIEAERERAKQDR